MQLGLFLFTIDDLRLRVCFIFGLGFEVAIGLRQVDYGRP
jgi:hypothetical protein